MFGLSMIAFIAVDGSLPSGIDFPQALLNNSVAVAALVLLVFTTRVRTGNDYDSQARQFEARLAEAERRLSERLSEKDHVIEQQAEIIRRFQEATSSSNIALRSTAQVLEAIPDRESAVLEEVRSAQREMATLVERLDSISRRGKKTP